MAVAKALGASRVIAVDIVPSRLEFAKSYAATDIYLPPKPLEGETKLKYSARNAKTLMEQLDIEERGHKAIDLVVDASGAEVSIQTGIIVARQGGTYVQVGMGAPEIQIPVTTLLVKELNFKGSFRYGVRLSMLLLNNSNVLMICVKLAWRLRARHRIGCTGKD